MPVTVTQVESLALPARLPRGQAIDNYAPWTYESVQGDSNADRWLAGIQFVPQGIPLTTLVATEDPCVQLTSFASKQGFDDPVTFMPFRIENAVTCSSLGGFTQEQLTNFVVAETERLSSYDLARQVWGVGGPNPDLRDQADVLTTAATPINAFSAVLGGLARRLKGGAGMIHFAPELLPHVEGYLKLNDDGQYETFNGHLAVFDDGYSGAGPAGDTSGSSWIYGSGPVLFKLSDVEIAGQWYEMFNRVHNDFVVEVARYGVVAFDPAYVVGAEVAIPTID